MQLLADAAGIEIDSMITCPHHGKNLVDAIAGRDKHDLCNGFIRGMDSSQRDEFFKCLSEAKKFKTYLEDPKRGAGDTKHKTTDATKQLSAREYDVSSYEDGIPLENCAWSIKDSSWNKQLEMTTACGTKVYYTTKNKL